MNKKEQEWSVGMLFLGVMLGVSGNLVANVIDRNFAHFGNLYDIVVGFIFIFFFVWVDKTLINVLKK